MQTRLTSSIANTSKGREAEAILRSCVHCGFCNATCPTYQLLGDERDGPRGRIYLIKQVLEGSAPTRETQLRLDRCLSCRACETTCPSGVQFGRLADIGRALVDKEVKRPWQQRLMRYALLHTVPYPARISTLIHAGRMFKPVLPASLKHTVPTVSKAASWPVRRHARKMLALDGCVQSVTRPSTNQALAVVLDKLGIELQIADKAGCCGAMAHHLSASEQALQMMRNNIDAWWPHVESGTEAIVVSASGCGMMVKDYGYLLRDDPDYADKAAKIASLTHDPVEVLAEALSGKDWAQLGQGERIAFQSPCSLQHGQKLTGKVETLLSSVGFSVLPVKDSHLCCGSAGSYSILQPALSTQLRTHKLEALNATQADQIVTANIGCQLHLSTPDRPLKHWIELIAENLNHV